MKASELIKELEMLITKHGDVTIVKYTYKKAKNKPIATAAVSRLHYLTEDHESQRTNQRT
jgi:hypothetical protein